MIKRILLMMLFSFVLVNVYADSCDNKELARLKKIAEQVEFSYDYDIKRTDSEEGILVDVDNKITAFNLNSEIKVLIYEDYYKDLYKEFKYNDTKKAILNGFTQGENLYVKV